MDDKYKFLERLIDCVSPSGKEDQAIKLVKEEFKDKADTFIFDNQGSLTTVYNKDAKFKIQLMAHCDEISLIVNGYNKNGTLTVASNGGVSPIIYVGSKVKILVDNNIIYGVVGKNAQLTKGEVKASDLFIDIGATNEKEAQDIVPLGSYIVHDESFFELNNHYVSGRAFDDRLGVFITQKAACFAKEKGSKIGIYATCSTGEETTGRGAYSSATLVKPDATIIVDVTYSTDYIGSNSPGNIELGKGGVICLGSIPNRKLNKLLEECAKKKKLDIQYEVWPARTATDGDTVIKTNFGEPVALFSIPLRYMHSPVEVASKQDIDSMIEILSEFLCCIDETYSLIPYEE